MLEVVLTYPTDEGTGEINLDGEKVSFGRGSDAEYRFEDDGLSRLHASIYREDDYIWVVDENSSNGTFVNGEKVGASGTPLEDGDTIKIGHFTNIKVKIREKEAVAESSTAQNGSNTQTVSTATNADEQKSSMLIPLAITGFALLLIGASVVFISFTVMGNNGTETAQNDPTEIEDDLDFPIKKKNLSKDKDSEGSSNDQTDGPTTSDPTGNDQTSSTTTIDENADITDSPTATKNGRTLSIPSGKNYQNMSEEEKNAYVKLKAQKVAQIIGNSSSESIPPEAVAQIRNFLDGYVGRIRSSRKNDCSMGGWLSSDTVSILERAKQNAPFIVREFNKKDISPYVGIYLAFIESEHCPCLQSPTKPLGLFQFTYKTAKAHDLKVNPNASPSNPDERCEKTAAARAAASYMNYLTGRIGTGPLSLPLAIASYNSGEGALGIHLKEVLTKNSNQERSFWVLVANKNIITNKYNEQFKNENIKYVPKFFATAIIGENPKDFGIDMLPLSAYTK